MTFLVLFFFYLFRYIKRTFDSATSFLKPEVIIILGDSLDEGSTAHSVAFLRNVKRLTSIFNKEKQFKTIYVAGDNDVGGEGFDFRDPWKLKRWEAYLKAKEKTVFKENFLRILTMHYDMHDLYDQDTPYLLKDLNKTGWGSFRVITNHMPIINRYRPQFEPLIEKTRANLIITAHTHHSYLITCVDCREGYYKVANTWFGGVRNLDNFYDIARLDISNPLIIHELNVATCSYRMGVQKMAYLSTVFQSNGTLLASLLHLPNRLRHLFDYAILIGLPFGLYLLTVLCYYCAKFVHLVGIRRSKGSTSQPI